MRIFRLPVLGATSDVSGLVEYAPHWHLKVKGKK